MNALKYFIFKNFNILLFFTVCCTLPLLLLMVRLKITRDFFLLFLVWNLVLAAVPFIISFWLQTRANLKKWHLYIGTVVWLLFLPNAPYIVTDFIHLQLSHGIGIMIDFVVISSFAIAGLWFYVWSVNQMKGLFKKHFGEKFTSLLVLGIPFLCGLGIYLGRFLRWNSWNILSSPNTLITDIIALLTFPLQYKFVWLFIITVGLLLHSLTTVYGRYYKK